MVKVGDKIECVYMDDPQPVPAGTTGIVYHIDSIGQIHVKWENGRGLALNPDVDTYKILEE